MEQHQVTYTQLYMGFVGLKESQISRHPLSGSMHIIGSQPLSMGMKSMFYKITENLMFLLIQEGELIVAQKTYNSEVEIKKAYDYFSERSVGNEGSGFYVDAPQGRIYVSLDRQPGDPLCLVASMY